MGVAPSLWISPARGGLATASYSPWALRTRVHTRLPPPRHLCLGPLRAAGSVPPTGGGFDKLERFLSKAGALSRSEARVRVRRGQVQVNGATAEDPWQLVGGKDRIEVVGLGVVSMPDWNNANLAQIAIFNKPKGVVVTMRRDDPLLGGRPTLADALPRPWRDRLAPHVPALQPVGRLDAPSMGLLLLTDSSGLAAGLLMPGVCEKEYLLRVRPAPTEDILRRLRSGVDIRDGNPKRGLTLPCEVNAIKSEEKSAVLRFRIHEGRNRQLRRMCAVVGLDVEWLVRVRVGPVELGDLPLGSARDATPEERRALMATAEKSSLRR
mmetsp:Transcript_66735/g.145556  ORF Transcript_66735/g.145556 Transcript_66735/m.145556 type:complete len:323 (-) Transcript_66735:14-982(-)